MRLSAALGVVVALVCAGRSDLGAGLVAPALGAFVLFIACEALWHARHPAPVRVVTR